MTLKRLSVSILTCAAFFILGGLFAFNMPNSTLRSPDIEQAGSQFIVAGTSRDTIQRIDIRENGSMIIWLRNDELRSYCVVPSNNALRDRIERIHFDRSRDPYVFLMFNSVRSEDEFASEFRHSCNSSDEESHETYYVIDVCYVNAEYGDLSLCNLTGRLLTQPYN